MTPGKPQRTSIVLAAAFSIVLLAGCAPTETGAQDDVGTPSASEPAATETSGQEPSAAEGPQEAFRAWLAASREPDAVTACGYLSDALVEKMLDEMDATGFPAADCAEMITATAALYAALGESTEVEVETRAESADAAELFVAYAEGDCGTVSMENDGSGWIMTEKSEEEC